MFVPAAPVGNAAERFLVATGSSGSSINASLLESLKMQLESQLERLDEESLGVMLRSTIELIHIKELRPVLITVVKHLKSIPVDFLRGLVQSGLISVSFPLKFSIMVSQYRHRFHFHFLQEFPSSVKQQAWKAEKTFYISSVEEVQQEQVFSGSLDKAQQAARLEQ